MTGTGWLELLYWACAGCVAYTFVGYPSILAAWSRLRPRPVRRASADDPRPSVSVVIAARDEAGAVARRVAEFSGAVEQAGLTGEIIVVSDGSTDGTAAAARSAARRGVPVTVVELPENVGKAAALTVGSRAARHEILALADARQTWADDALVRLLENFADPGVGAVSGELHVRSAPGVMAGVGLYWRYEKALRRMEGLVGSTAGVTGAIAAVRRGLFRPVPRGTLLDDVYWPLCVAMQGGRVVFDPRARAYDRLPERVRDELRRKVRTLAGNFQLLTLLPGSLLPWRNPVWFVWVSHKLARLAVPWALLGTVALSAALGGRIYTWLLLAQTAATLIGLAGFLPAVAARSRLASAGASFLALNTAAWLAFWVWVAGGASRSWTKTAYRTSTATAPAGGATP